MLGACETTLGTDTLVLRAAETHPSDYPTALALKYMGILLEEWSDGDLAIKLYTGGQLGEEKDTLEITIFGGMLFSTFFTLYVIPTQPLPPLLFAIVDVFTPPFPTPAAQLGLGIRDHFAYKVVFTLIVIAPPNAKLVPDPFAAVFQPVNS